MRVKPHYLSSSKIKYKFSFQQLRVNFLQRKNKYDCRSGNLYIFAANYTTVWKS